MQGSNLLQSHTPSKGKLNILNHNNKMHDCVIKIVLEIQCVIGLAIRLFMFY